MIHKIFAVWKIITSCEYLCITTKGIVGSYRKNDYGGIIRNLTDSITEKLKERPDGEDR